MYPTLHLQSNRFSWHCFVCLVYICFHPVANVWAQAVPSENSSNFTPPPGQSLAWINIVLKTTFWLFIIIVAIFATILLLKRFVTPTITMNSLRPVRLLFQESLQPGKSICLIRVIDQIHVVGVTNSQISYLATLDDDEVDQIDHWLNRPDSAGGNSGGMSKIQQFLKRFGSQS